MIERGVIVEFDFAAMGGADILFKTVKKHLAALDRIPFDARLEAQYLAGGNLQGGLADYFAVVKTKKTAAKAARDIDEAFRAALTAAVPDSITTGFRNFTKALVDAGIKVVISTRADLEAARAALAPLLSEKVCLYAEVSTTYGSVKWDAWRRACVRNRLYPAATAAVTGSGFGAKAALLAGMPAMAVVNDRVEYQDFTGADAAVRELNAAAAKTLLGILRR